MSESFDKTLNLLKDLNLEDFSKHSFRGIEKESLRVSNKTISTTDHPASLGSTLTNQFITTDFSEALLELITNKKNTINSSLKQLEEILNFSCERLKIKRYVRWDSVNCIKGILNEEGKSIPWYNYEIFDMLNIIFEYTSSKLSIK